MLKKIKFYFERLVLKRRLKIDASLTSYESMRLLNEFEESRLIKYFD
jgi:hypothetical protein